MKLPEGDVDPLTHQQAPQHISQHISQHVSHTQKWLLCLAISESLLAGVSAFSRLFSRIACQGKSKKKFDPLPFSTWNVTAQSVVILKS